ncbi:MAG: dihydroneopterin aldolase [Myxococcota bacterium]|nr:dihydroneopterin aldolase [Myxococcota bacterium]
MNGTIGLEGLKIRCIIGIHPAEREVEQDLLVDVCVTTDFAPAASHDSVEHTIDYDRIAAELTRLAVERRYQLLETFAEEAAGQLFALFRSIEAVELTIRKPAAVPAADCSLVRLHRSRPASS